MGMAAFNLNHHATRAGWATYHKRNGLRRWLCVFGHPQAAPAEPPDGYSPQCYARCPRCKCHIKWYVIGQHRFGGMRAPA